MKLLKNMILFLCIHKHLDVRNVLNHTLLRCQPCLQGGRNMGDFLVLIYIFKVCFKEYI